MNGSRSEAAGVLWALAAILIWATLAACVGDALDRIPWPTLLATALAFSSLTLLGIDLARGRTLRATFVAPRPVVAVGLWGIFGYHALFFAALAKAPLVEANLLNYLWPLFMVLLAPVLLRERLTPLVLGGASLGFLGAALVVSQGKALDLSREHALGYALAAGAALSWSSFSVLVKRLGPPAADRMTLYVTASLVPSVALALATEGFRPPTGRALVAAAWLGIGPMGMAFFAWNKALALTSAARIGLLSYLDPLLSTLALAAFLAKPISRASALGMVLIVVGAAGPGLLARSKAPSH